MREIMDSMRKMLNIFSVPYLYILKWTKNSTGRLKMHSMTASHGGLNIHLGCGDRHISGMLNCEYRATRAADVVMDCGNLKRFKSQSARMIFSHAFFEHLYRNQQLPLLQDCFRVLKDDGILVFLGIPDFEVIAKHYLSHSPGIKGPIFDLYNVYRYTHGDPEIAQGYWLEQLHKSIFDKRYLTTLLSSAGFTNVTIFNYCYPGESIPLNLGFIAGKSGKVSEIEIKGVLEPFKEYLDNVDDIHSCDALL